VSKKLATGRVLEKQDEDRRRLARQLHDSVAQHGAALQINLSLIAESQQALHRRAVKALSDSIDLAQTLAREVREIASSLHPPLLDQFGLVAAFEASAQRFSEQTGVKMKLDLPAHLERLPTQIEIGLFRIVEEALPNVHAEDPTASLSLMRTPKSLVMELSVPGSGRTAAIGVIRERARLLKGRLTVQRGRRKTRFRLVLPLNGRKKSTSAGS
jgi:signal transduction histidine kinase